MTTPIVKVFVAHLPKLSEAQTVKILAWARHFCIDAHILRGATDDLYAVLEVGRSQKSLQNLLNTNCNNWDIQRPKHQRGWFEALTVDEYLSAAGPSDAFRQLVTQTIQTAVGRVIDKFEFEKSRRELMILKLARAVESAMTKNAKACTASAWHELAAPVRVRKEKEQQCEMEERRRKALERAAERQRLIEEQKKQRAEEEAKQKQKDLERSVKCRRLSQEWVNRTGIICALPFPADMENVETLADIPAVKAQLESLGLL